MKKNSIFTALALALLCAAPVLRGENYSKLFEKQKACEKGMITLHLSEGKVYFELPDSLLSREFVMGSTIKSISDNAHGVVGSKPLELKHFTFTKADSTIQMRTVNTTFVSDDSNISAALEKSNIGAVTKTFKIEAWNEDSTAMVFNVTDIFLEDDEEMSPFIEYAAYGDYKRDKTFKKDLSYIEGIKAFDDNVSVTSLMSYVYDMSDNGKSIRKKTPLTAELTRSILLLPKEIYHPRGADYRIGVFWSERTKLASGTSDSKDIFLANRWRLEPSDEQAYRRGELVEPVKPIVFYVDKNFPEWWKPYIMEAVQQWQEPFEAIGFKNAVIAEPFPEDDPEFDPDNIKYSCIRYAPVGVQNAMGPSWVDPRSGEIINASVYVYHDIVKLIQRWMFIQTSQADPDVRKAEFSHEVLGDAIRYVIAHEVGHCLGFMHNMGASSTIPVEMLRDPEFTQKTGTTVSIMDYARFNYVAQPGDKERGVKLTPPRFGAYDKWLVEWTYTPVYGIENIEDEFAVTSNWISEALKKGPEYRYGKQQSTSGFFDPRDQNEDLGDNSVAATRYGVKNLKYITENFMEWLSAGDDEYELRTEIFNGILNQYLAYAQHVTLNIGGLYKNEVKKGDEMPRFQNIPRERQLEALDYLFTLWKDCEWMYSDEVKTLPIVGSPVNAVRSSIESFILMTPSLASMSDGVATKELSSKELFQMISDRVFESTKKGKKLTQAERSFQRNFIESYMSMGNFAVPASTSFAISEDAVSTSMHFQCSAGHEHDMMGDGASTFGELMYSPVAGYEWIPRNIFNQGDLTMPTIYAVLTDVRDVLNKAVKSAKGDDKAHYKFLLNIINYSVK